jgi:UPF0755 protein
MHGSAAKIKAGVYRLNDGMRVGEILRKLVAGEVDVTKFAVPEGYSIYQIGELLEAREILNKDNFIRCCFNRELLRELKIDGTSVEGFIYPCTYNISPRMKGEDLVRMMVSQFHKVYDQKLSAGEMQRGMKLKEILTLASIIEKEAVIASERPLISSVFHNRLKKGMRLQSDPTAVYGIRAFSGKVTKNDILRSTPYNTYLIAGLPPGPIGNPSNASVEAVLNPAPTDYLYFVARKDGTHQFSKTLAEHNRAVRRYLLNSAINVEHLTPAVTRGAYVCASITGGR